MIAAIYSTTTGVVRVVVVGPESHAQLQLKAGESYRAVDTDNPNIHIDPVTLVVSPLASPSAPIG